MAEHGGYRKPKRPAPVSGPGRLSRRTDGGPAQNVARLPNAGYGESAEFEQIQGGAPMSATPPVDGGSPAAGSSGAVPADLGGLSALLGGGGSPAQAPTPLSSGTERPDEPITAGAPVGLGPGPAPEVIGPANRISDLLARMLDNDLSGEVAELYHNAVARGL